jgi:hypothetical protein
VALGAVLGYLFVDKLRLIPPYSMIDAQMNPATHEARTVVGSVTGAVSSAYDYVTGLFN